MKPNPTYLTGLCCIVCCLSSLSKANEINNDTSLVVEPRELKKLARYTNTFVDHKISQAMPLKTVVSITLPNPIYRVSQAINYALSGSGYELLTPANTHENTRTMYDLPLPKIHRAFHQQTLESVLKILASDAFILLKDPIKRQVTFIPAFRYDTRDDELDPASVSQLTNNIQD